MDGGMNIILYIVGVTDGSVCERPLVGDVETLAPLVGGRVGLCVVERASVDRPSSQQL
jgi:hypothetical protein